MHCCPCAPSLCSLLIAERHKRTCFHLFLHAVCSDPRTVQWKVAAALAAGNTIVLKPSEVASVTCLELAEICSSAGLPRGVLNVVTGTGPDAGAPLRCQSLGMFEAVHRRCQLWGDMYIESVHAARGRGGTPGQPGAPF